MKKNITLFVFLLSIFFSKSFSQVTYPCGKYFIEMNGTSLHGGSWSQAYNYPDITLAAWVQLTDPSSIGNRMMIFNRYDFNYSGENTDFSLAINESGEVVFISRVINSSDPSKLYDSVLFNLKPKISVWYHVAMTFDGTTHQCKTYVNGELSNTKTFGGALSYISEGSAYSHYISFGVRNGKNAGFSNFFKGYLDEAVYCSKALTAAQIKTLAQGVTPGDAFLKDNSVIIYHKFNDYPSQPNYGIGGGGLPTSGQYHSCPAFYTISGKISYIADGSLLPEKKIFEGATVKASGTTSSSVTNIVGYYSLLVPSGYTGTITPTYKNLKCFQPDKIDVNNVQSDLKDQDIVCNPTLAVPTYITSPVGFPQLPLACVCKAQSHKNLPADEPCNPPIVEPEPGKKYGWRFHQRCGHKIGNLGDARFAWDINLNDDLDKNRKVYAVADGIVMSSTDFPAWGGSSSGQLLVKHINPSGGVWYSGYLHMKQITKSKQVSEGDFQVSEGDFLGYISNVDFKNIDGKYMQDPKTPNHLHFAVHYEDPFDEKYLRSVDFADFSILPRIVPATEWNITASGSIVSGALVSIKTDSIWNEYGRTDENGKLTLLFMPSVKYGDSIKIIASGYEEINFAADSNSIASSNIIVPLIPTSTPSNKIRYASVTSLDQKTFYETPTVRLKVLGQNISAYDIIKETDLGDSLAVENVFINKPFADSLVNIALSVTGTNTYKFVFKGVDTVELYKSFEYRPGATGSYNVSLGVPSSIAGSQLYVDGSYIKSSNNTIETIRLLSGEHILNVKADGYKDTTFRVSAAGTYNLSLIPESYIQPDSIVFDFPAHGKIQYHKNVTALDSAMQTVVSIKQGMANFSNLGLIPKSRKFEFRHLNTKWSGMKFVTVLNQQERLSTDSVYLLRIYNDTSFTKIQFSAKQVRAKYDSVEQKLSYDFIDFNKGNALKEALVIIKKQAPIIKAFSDLTINADTSLSIPFNQIFSDPDSLRNDLTYHLLDTTPTGLHLSLKGDSLIINTEKSYEGTTIITIVAEHDSLLAAKTITVTVASGGPLPITLLNFSGSLVRNQVLLNWQTAQEINTSHFIIERGTSAVDFYAIGKLNASGNSSTSKDYSYTDIQPFEGINFYRLKIVDTDGKFTYSKIVAVKNDNNDNSLTVFPNPANEILYVQSNGDNDFTTLQIFDVSGRKLKEEKIVLNGLTSFSINVKDLPKGVYSLLLKSNTKNEHHKFVKQ